MTSAEHETELAALLRAALAGDEKAYAEFLRRTAILARAMARRQIVFGGVDAEDVVQDVLLAIHLKRHTWMADAPVMPWIRAIVRHKLIDAFRKRGRRIEVEIEDILDIAEEPQPDTVSSREVDRALQSLAPVQRSVVGAISIEGLSIREAAAKLAMNETAVRVALHRGLAAISRKFGRS